MKNIWAPWRVEYILGPKTESCFLCNAPKEADSLLVRKGTYCFAIMNRFPYTTGHIMIAPYRHIPYLTDLDNNESSELMIMLQKLSAAIRTAMNPDGFNVGCNIGSVAGAGVASHIHFHIVPRWNGDTNFMPVLSDVHMISEHLEKTRNKIMEALD
ncbi:MAG: HIT domain-containing protein [Deltaproteobacteria bacterium]|nr:HIT domain-containing protein [Deltaproteobacteria bacterium]